MWWGGGGVGGASSPPDASESSPIPIRNGRLVSFKHQFLLQKTVKESGDLPRLGALGGGGGGRWAVGGGVTFYLPYCTMVISKY
jgi:hypothetical protein